MPIDIHGLAKRYASLPGVDPGSIKKSVKAFRSTLQGRKKELLKPFGLDDLDKFRDDPESFVKMVAAARESFREKKEQDASYRKLYENERCLVTFTAKPEGAAAAGSHLKVAGEPHCPWCICVKYPENEKWWREYEAAALVFIYAKDDACCILLTPHDALETLEGRFTFSQAEGIENTGLNGKPEEQRKVLKRLYGKSGLSDSRMVGLLRPVLKPMQGELERLDKVLGLFPAVKDGDIERVKVCLEAGADVKAAAKHGETLLHRAAHEGLPEICKLLLDAGADVNARDKFGFTPLHRVSNKNGCVETNRLLLDAGANVKARDDNGYTPLHMAACNGRVEICKMLVDAGADVNAVEGVDQTPLFLSAGHGYANVCRFLINSGADVNARDMIGRTPLYRAMGMAFPEVCKVLIDAGADVNARDNHGHAPLSVVRHNQGLSRLSFSRENENRKIVEMLIRAGARE